MYFLLMHKIRTISLHWSATTFLVWVASILLLVYIALISIVMTYATLTVEFAESVRDDQSAVASLEASYLEEVRALSSVDYRSLGFVEPKAKVFVKSAPVTALR